DVAHHRPAGARRPRRRGPPRPPPGRGHVHRRTEGHLAAAPHQLHGGGGRQRLHRLHRTHLGGEGEGRGGGGRAARAATGSGRRPHRAAAPGRRTPHGRRDLAPVGGAVSPPDAAHPQVAVAVRTAARDV